MNLNKMLLSLALAGLAITAAVPTANAAPPIPLYLNERRLELPAPPVMGGDRVLVPLRGYMEALGAQVGWQPPGSITVQLRDRTVYFSIGSTEARVGGKSVKLDVPAQLIDDLTYVPLRFLSEGLGATVQYDGTAVRVTAPVDRRVVADGPLNVRQAPSLTAPVMLAAPTGSAFDLLSVGAEWSQVLLPKGRTGWVATRFIAPIRARRPLDPFAELLSGPTGYLQVQGRCLGLVPMLNGHLNVPLRATVAQLGGQVTGAGLPVHVHFRGQDLRLPAEALIQVGDELMVPARTLSDKLGLSIAWDDFRQTGMLDVPGIARADDPGCSPGAAVSAYVIMDARSGLTLSEQRADVTRPIASITKIMTALLALERGNPDTVVTVSRNAAGMIGTRMELRTGDRVRMQDLLYGLMLPSGNDAAAAIAESLSGSETAFAQLMTRRAVELGASNTRFYNASGLDDWVKPYSTARDMATIAREAMRNPDFRAIVDTGVYRFTGPRGARVLTNKNDFVLTYPGATGVKSGWTEIAGHTLVVSAYRDGVELIVVMLGSGSRAQLYAQATRLMDHGFHLAEESWLYKN